MCNKLSLCFITGEDAFVHELVDIIIAARMAKKYEKNGNFPICGDAERNKVFDNSLCYGLCAISFKAC